MSLLPNPTPDRRKTAEDSILHLARTQPSFTRNQLHEQLEVDGVETCYQAALDKVERDGFIEDEGGGVWRSLICRTAL